MISVIVPAYNAEKYLAECLSSILSQSFRDIEIILVNDGSTDSTPDIARDFASRDTRVKILSTENRGVSSARNFGIEQSRGEWITFVDSDDCLTPDALVKLYNTAIKTGARIIIGSCAESEESIMSSPRMLTPADAIEMTLYQTSSLIPSSWGILYHRDIVKEVLFTPGIRYEDLDVFYRFYDKADSIAVIPDRVYFYRRNEDSFINTFTPARLDALTVTEKIEHYMAGHHPHLLPAARDRRLSAGFNILNLLERQDSDTYDGIKKQCWDIIRQYRVESLCNPRVRMKNKIGILVSFLGPRIYRLIALSTKI